METDSFFWQLLQQLPETLFDLLHLPITQAAHYRFDSVELKKSLRIDGLFVPKVATLPVYFVEVQFRRMAKFLLASPRVKRIYLNELQVPAEATLGLRIMELVTAPAQRTPEMVTNLLASARRQRDSDLASRVVELVEELLIRRFTHLDREEVRRMFQLADLRKTRVWQEAHEEGMALARERMIRAQLSKGKGVKQIAEDLDLPIAEVRRVARTVTRGRS